MKKLVAKVERVGRMKFTITPSYTKTETELKPLLKFLWSKGFENARITTARFGSYISLTQPVGYRYYGASGQDMVKLLRTLLSKYNSM